MSWELVAVLMVAEIVSNGMLSLPSSLAVVGAVPGAIIIVFLGVFATFTSWVLIQFKLRHPGGVFSLFVATHCSSPHYTCTTYAHAHTRKPMGVCPPPFMTTYLLS